MPLIRNGHSTTVAFGTADPGFPATLVEKSVTPPGWDGGGFIDITNMRNVLLRTRISKSLITLTPMTLTVQWDPISMTTGVFSALQVNQIVTITYPDGSAMAFAGWVDTFEPPEHKEGEEPVAKMTVIPSNIDPLDGVSETLPAYTAP
jgi:hypothetical protein